MTTTAAMRFLLECCPLGLSQHRENGVFVAASATCERLLGYTASQLLQSDLFSCLVVEQTAQLREAWSLACAESMPRTIRVLHTRPMGAPVWLEVTLLGVRDSGTGKEGEEAQNSSLYVHCSLRDITEQVAEESARAARLAEAEMAERHRDYLVRMTPGLIWFGPVSPDLSSYRATYMSEYLFRVTGYTSTQWLQTPGFWRSIIHPEDRDQILAESPSAMREERPLGPYRIIASDGRVLWIQSQVVLERDAAGVPVRMYGLTLDMTSFKEAETERSRLQRELADQARRLLEESTPLIPISDSVLVMPVIGTLDPARAQHALHTVLNGITQSRARCVLVDLTGVSTVDAEGVSALLRMTQAVRLLGARVILTGMRSEIAQSLIRMEVELTGVTTRSTLRAAISELVVGTSTLTTTRSMKPLG